MFTGHRVKGKFVPPANNANPRNPPKGKSQCPPNPNPPPAP